MTPAQLTRLADPTITSELRGFPASRRCSIVGEVERELTVQLQPQALQAAGLSVAQVVQALQSQNLAAPVGSVNGDLDERAIRLQGRLEGPQDFMQPRRCRAQRSARAARPGRRCSRRHAGAADRSRSTTASEAIGIDVTKSKGYSTTAVSNKIRTTVERDPENAATGCQDRQSFKRRRSFA